MDASPVDIASDHLDQVVRLYDEGLFLQAYELAKTQGPLSSWCGPEAMVFACRLAAQVGGAGLGRWIIRRAWRQFPNHASVRYYYASNLAAARGPYAAWRWMHEIGEPGNESDNILRADWYALVGQLAASLRDFDTADVWFRRAGDLMPSHAWIEVCRAAAFEYEDRYDDALTAARHALELRPWYCPAVESAAHLLTLLDRDAEAQQLLVDASERVESPRIVGQLYALHVELRNYERARELLERCVALAPLAGKPFQRWLTAQRSDIAYHLGDISAATQYAKQAGPGFHQRIAARIEEKSLAEGRQRLLPVGFVRQHRMTCVPATLSAISRFWSQPADHLQVAEEICYNGTTAYNERKWARTHGWHAREFTVTEASASALVDRGVPFTFTTIEPTSAHLQAVIGYDDRRGTFWIRDPFWRNTSEMIVDKTLEQYQAFGPRGMALVPVAEKARLEGLDLPDAPLWDLLHELDAALVDHQRDKAAAIFRQMSTEADGHRLSRMARLRLAWYDGNPIERLAALEQLLQLSPNDPCLELQRLTCLRDLARRDQRMDVYRQLCEKRDVAPVFLHLYAQELRADARRHNEAIALLQRAIRRAPNDAGGYSHLAEVFWAQRRFEEAFVLYRFVTCMNDKDESAADSYFRAARWLKRTEEALVFLRGRFHRFGKLSSRSARTLVNAFLQCNRTTDALNALEEAMRLRPDDGELMLFAVDVYLACSREKMPLASSLLAKAKDAATQAYWLQTAARLATQDNRPSDAIDLWRQFLELQPLATDAHQAVAQLLLETQGKAALLAHLTAAADRFPHHLPLHQLWLQWVRDEPAEVREPVIRRAVAMSPHDAWLHRELGFFLAEQRRFAEAWQEADVAGELEPNVPSYHALRAQLLRDEGKIDEAKTALREAIRLSVDYRSAIDEAIALCSSADERREWLAFVKEELVRQVTFGDGLLAFRGQSHGTLPPDELLTILREALTERPDLWHAWSACIQQLLALDQRDEAWTMAQQATDRFPLLPPLWLDRAAACRARQDWPAEREALETAYQINPDWADAVFGLTDFHERQGEFPEARRLLEQAVARQPQNANNHIMLAECLWRQNQSEAALERIRCAVDLYPGSERAWNDLKGLAAQLGRRDTVVEIARQLTNTRGSEARSWFLLADALDAPDQRTERLEALDKTIALAPRFVMAHDRRAMTLADANRWNDARLACSPAAWNDNPPLELKGRAIYLLAQQQKVREAIREMRSLLAKEPGYYTGWCWLWEWCRLQRDYTGCREAAEALVRNSPQNEVCLGYLGEGNRLDGNLDRAKAAFQRAFDLNPRYQYAGVALFDMQLADKQLDDAAATLSRLQHYNNNSLVLMRAVQLAAKQADHLARVARSSLAGKLRQFFGMAVPGQDRFKESAIRHFQQLCTTPCDETGCVSVAVDAMIYAGWMRSANDILKEALVKEGAPSEVGRQWVRLSKPRSNGRCEKVLRKLAGKGPIAAEATAAYIERLIAAKQRWRFRRFLWKNKSWLRGDDRIWGAAGYAMITFGWNSRLVRWMADWRQRKAVESWMLFNLVEGLRTLRRDAEATAAGQYALTLRADHTHLAHRVWLAADAARNGQIDAARQLLDEIPSEAVKDFSAFLRDLTSTVVDMASAAPSRKSDVFADVRQRVSLAAYRYRRYRRGAARRRFYHDCLRLIAQYRGGLNARVWSWLCRLTSVF